MNKIAFLLKTLVLSAVFLSFLPENSFGQFTVKYYDPDEVVEADRIKTQDLTSLSDVCSITTIISITMTEDYTAESAAEFYISIESTVDDDKFFDLNGHTLNLNGGKINAPNDAEFIFKNGTIKSSNAPVIESYSPMRFANITVSSTSDDNQASLIYNNMSVYLEAGCTFTIPSKKFFVTAYEAYLANDLLVFADENGVPLQVHLNSDDNLGGYILDGETVKTVDATYFKVEYGDKQKYFPSLEKALQSTSYSNETSVPSSVKITLLKNYERNMRYLHDHPDDIVVPFNVEIDLQNYTFKDTLLLDISKKFTISNASSAQIYAYFNLLAGAELILNGGEYHFYSEVVNLQGGSAKLSNVKFKAACRSAVYGVAVNMHTPDYTACVSNNGGTLTIENGTFSYDNDDDDHYGVYTTAGTTTINGGTFSGSHGLFIEHGQVTVKAGTFTGTNNGVWVQETYNIDDVVIEDGKFSGTGTYSSGIGFNEMGSGTIKGGTFTGGYGLAADRSGVNLFGGKFDGQIAAVKENEKVINLKDGGTQYAFYDADDIMLYFPDETDEVDKYIQLNP